MRENNYDIIEAFLNFENKHFIIFEKEYENQFYDFGDEDVEEKGKSINEKLSNFPIHQLIKQIKLIVVLWHFDAVSSYPSAMWDENNFYSKIETGYAFTRDIND